MIDFFTFFEALRSGAGHRHVTPYPWQIDLATRFADGSPPAVIAVPTGCGKTATIEALLWALCCQADLTPHERTVGVRTVWAIDRRILVDEVYDHACRLANRLRIAAADSGDVLHDAAQSLLSYTAGYGEPLTIARWRGQVRIEPRAHHPLQPQLITSTVAQIGSRLLFRGYGVGERSLALEAALAGVDCNICLDEAHLAQPFRQTVQAVCERRRESEPTGSFGPLTVIELTATPPACGGDVVTLGTEDEPRLASRMDAVKRATLEDPGSDGAIEQTRALLAAVVEHVNAGARRVACVVNTVLQACALADAARKQLDDRVDLALLIGPQRPHDRAAVLDRHGGAMFQRAATPRPLLVIATQTIEVGLDADFDALVTQSASATALIQRFGRVNRSGLGEGRGTIVRQRTTPLYEQHEEACWQWLVGRRAADGTVDMSPRAIAASAAPQDASSPFTPTLTAATVALLRQTAPTPAPMADPPVDCFLRGVDATASDDVLVCWRDDLQLERHDEAAQGYRAALLALAPPQPAELMPIGVRRLHALLAARVASGAGRALVDAATGGVDVEGMDDSSTRSAAESRVAFLIARDDIVLEVSPDSTSTPGDVRPGDVVVLPSSAGGYLNGALAPTSGALVPDVGAAVAAADLGVRRAAFRLCGGSALGLARRLARERRPATDDELRQLLSTIDRDVTVTTDLVGVVVRVGERDDELEEDDSQASGPMDGDGGTDGADALDMCVLIVSPRPEDRPDRLRTVTTPPPTLDAHELAVAARAQLFAAAVGDSFTPAIVCAARAHDHGKADERIQAFFRRGVLGLGATLLAKSTFGTDDRATANRAADRAGLPRGLRHEIASVTILSEHLKKRPPDGGWDFDEQLALHLVATHHGLGRPWPPAPHGGAPPRPFFVDEAGIAGTAHGDGRDGWDNGRWLRRFIAVNERYGAWGTAYLEAILMLADRTVSAEGH